MRSYIPTSLSLFHPAHRHSGGLQVFERARQIQEGLGAGLAANGEPDFVAQVVEIVVEDGHLTFAAAIDGEGEFLHDPSRPLRHHQNAPGQVDGFVDVVGDHDNGLARRLPQPQQLVLHPLPRQGVERTERLVEQEDFRIVGERAGDRDALLHAAGELARKTMFEALQADRADEAFDDLFALLR